MVQLWILFWFFNPIFWKPCESMYQPGTTTRILKKISRMTLELVIDANSKIELVNSFKPSHVKQRVYQYGEIVYKIRKHLRRMVFLYRQALDVIESGNRDLGRDVGKLVEVEALGREIDHLVAMIELSRKKNNTNPVKPTARFLRSGEGKIWENLMDSYHFDLDPKPTPSVTEKRVKRVNQKWEFAVPDAFDK